MTKIKDLAVMAVDNAFTQFPVDSERYELRATLTRYREVTRWESKDERINRFVLDLDGQLLKAALCYYQVHNDLSFSHSKLTQDRARRVEATIITWVGSRLERARVALPEVTASNLLVAVVEALDATERVFYRRPERTGGNP